MSFCEARAASEPVLQAEEMRRKRQPSPQVRFHGPDAQRAAGAPLQLQPDCSPGLPVSFAPVSTPSPYHAGFSASIPFLSFRYSGSIRQTPSANRQSRAGELRRSGRSVLKRGTF